MENGTERTIETGAAPASGVGRPLRAAFRTLGCKVNHYETAVLRDAFLRDGFEVVPFEAEADVYVVNTCTVTGQAARKTGQFLRQARERSPGAIRVAVGCHVQRSEGAFPDAEVLIGTLGRGEAPRLAREAIAARDAGRPAQADRRRGLAGALPYEDPDAVGDVEDVRAYVKVQDGCDARCTYCAIPLARGPSRSRAPDPVVEEVSRLVAAGCREVVLTGIHASDYGSGGSGAVRDATGTTGAIGASGVIGETAPAVPLLVLAARVAAVPGLLRVRLGSIEPDALDARFVREAARIPALCPHLHVPLQSGSAGVLARMGRTYGPERYIAAVEEYRATFPLGAVTTDLIVGFPGETDAEYEESLVFCGRAGFARLHVFRYSDRKGTAAWRMDRKVPEDRITERARRMQALSDRLALSFHARLAGQVRTVLVESFAKDGDAVGYTPEYVRARIRRAVGEPPPVKGALVSMRIDGWDVQGVRGVPV